MEAEDTSTAPSDDLTAEQILKRVGEVYATCATYEDTGVVESVTLLNEKQRVEVTLFATVFERANCFRFEYHRQNERYILWATGSRVKSWLSISIWANLLLWIMMFIYRLLFRKEHLLDFGIASATGISRGAANTIPGILFPELVRGWRLTSLMDAERIEDSYLDGVHCLRVQGQHVGDFRMLWIDRKTFLVRRIDTRYENSQTKETTTYYPIVNQPIDPQKFEFKPSRK